MTASGSITSWQIDGETMETVRDFIFWGSIITADGDCSHEIKRLFFLGRKTTTNLNSILKSRDITLPTKVHLVKAMVFLVVVYGWELDCKESWALKNWCFWTVVLEKTLETPLDCKEIQPKGKSVLNIHWKDWCWSSNTLAIWCKELTYLQSPWCWERLKARGEEDNRGWDGWMASPTRWTWVWISSRSCWWIGKPGVLQSMVSQSQTWLSDWTELRSSAHFFFFYIELHEVFVKFGD